MNLVELELFVEGEDGFIIRRIGIAKMFRIMVSPFDLTRNRRGGLLEIHIKHSLFGGGSRTGNSGLGFHA